VLLKQRPTPGKGKLIACSSGLLTIVGNRSIPFQPGAPFKLMEAIKIKTKDGFLPQFYLRRFFFAVRSFFAEMKLSLF
jgi:hypothetical protein